MRMRLPSRVILCFAVGSFAVVFQALAADFSFRPSSGECVLSRSSRSEKNVVAAALARLNSRFSGACSFLKDPMEDAFSSSAQGIWKAAGESGKFGFWVDVSADGAEMMVRGIDLDSLFSWGQSKASTVNLSETSKLNLVKALIDRVIEQYPFVGYVEGRAFFAWTKAGATKVGVVSKKDSVRHPFLPFLLQMDYEVVSSAYGVLSRDENERGWKLVFGKGYQSIPNRLWLRASSAGGP